MRNCLVNRYSKGVFDPVYNVLVGVRPSFFARYLSFQAVKPA